MFVQRLFSLGGSGEKKKKKCKNGIQILLVNSKFGWFIQVHGWMDGWQYFPFSFPNYWKYCFSLWKFIVPFSSAPCKIWSICEVSLSQTLSNSNKQVRDRSKSLSFLPDVTPSSLTRTKQNLKKKQQKMNWSACGLTICFPAPYLSWFSSLIINYDI